MSTFRSTALGRRLLLVLLVGIGFGGAVGTAVSAVVGEPDRDAADGQAPIPPTGTEITPQAFGGLAAPNARMAGLFDAGGAPVRTRNIQSIQRLSTGVYCILPALENIHPGNSIAQASPEYFFSEVDEISVQWASAGASCGNSRFAVLTFTDSNLDGNYVLSDDVAFSIIVP